MTAIAIIIPARYASTRFPGKPMAMIAGESMLSRVYRLARDAAAGMDDVSITIASEDQRIVDHAASFGSAAVFTPAGPGRTGCWRRCPPCPGGRILL